MSITQRAGVALLTALILAGLAGCTQTPSSTGQSPSAPPSPGGTASGQVAPQSSPGSSQFKGLPAVPGIVKEIEPAVVTIRTEIGLGSGVVYHSDGTIVTDAHVVENQQKQPYKTVNVQFADGKRASATVVGVDDLTDVAVIKADRTGLPAAKFSTGSPVVGQLSVVIGSPLGLVETVTAGIVSALHRNIPPSKESPQGLFNLIQTDAPISPGNSGGAVVNGDAQVIGLSEAYLPPSSGAVAIGFVTPSATVTDVADQLLKSGTVKHAFLGVSLADITPQVAQRFQLSTSSGALVIGVVNGGPAGKAGIESGDIITTFDGKKIQQVEDLLAALRKRQPGQQVKILIQRGKESRTLTITLGDRPN